MKSYKDAFPTGDTDWAYFKALADVIWAAASAAKNFNASKGKEDDVRLEFTFDSRIESNGAASTMYTTLANQPEWAGCGIFDTTIVFESGGGKDPCLEMGDLLARESMKELERKITNARPNIRGARKALEGSKKFHFIEREREYWDALKEMCQRPESDVLMKEWDEWLIARGMIQGGRPARNHSNWFVFNAWLDHRNVIAAATMKTA